MSIFKRYPEGMSPTEIRKLKRKRRIRRRKRIVTAVLLFGAAIGILFTPLFDLSEVVIEGNEKITAEEIIKKGELEVGKNLFTFNLNKIGGRLEKIPYVNSLLIKRKLPDKIVIKITESAPVAYIPAKNGYVVIDKTGKALEATDDNTLYEIPVAKDISADKFTLSEKIITDNKENFQKTLEILRDLYNNNFIREILSVETVDGKIILKITDELVVDMGEYERFNAKIVMVKEVVASLPENAVGRIDASNPDKVYYNKTPPAIPEEEAVEEQTGEENAPQEPPAEAEAPSGG